MDRVLSGQAALDPDVCMAQQCIHTMTQADAAQGLGLDEYTPASPAEREMVRNLLRGLRSLQRRGIPVRFQWVRVRRSPRAGAPTMFVELDAGDHENVDT
jgi:hypothetical protein